MRWVGTFDRFCYGDSNSDQPSYELGFAVMLEDAWSSTTSRPSRRQLHVDTL